MKVLHTSDWHLGIRFLGKDRESEQQKTLDWIISTIKSEKIDVLIIAGDIFDTGTPSNTARKLYFSFLRKLLKTDCSHAVIIGGNHDSPSMLNAPAEILKELNIHTIGCANRDDDGAIDYNAEVITLKNDEGETVCAVAAVPFLRDRDLMLSMAGLEYDERIKEVQKGIINHYEAVADRCKKFDNIPVIACGHLFASGAQLSDNANKQEGENDIHIGNLARVDFSSFLNTFSYIALGHIHRPQVLGGNEAIRYSGSIIPISFSERQDVKSVSIADFGQNKCVGVKTLEIPQTVKLIRFKGDFESIIAKINNHKNEEAYTYWGEIILTERLGAVSINKIKDCAIAKNIEILKTSFSIAQAEKQENNTHSLRLDELTVDDIFEMRCKAETITEKEEKMLKETFSELKSLMTED